MTVQEYICDIWEYYLLLESDFVQTLNYVELSSDNYNAFSKEYAKQLLSIGSEVDVICKKLCAYIDPQGTFEKMSHYQPTLSGYSDFMNGTVIHVVTREEVKPFEAWITGNSLPWWTSYNTVKHNRLENDNRKEANLKNVFHALAGLYSLNRYMYRDFVAAMETVKEPEPKSKIFKMKGWTEAQTVMGGLSMLTRRNGNTGIMM